MIDKLYFFYCTLLSFSGYVFALYGVMARHKIEMETKMGLEKGFDFDTEDGNEYFANKFKNWKAGTSFDSSNALLIGFVFVLLGGGLNLVNNKWWTSVLLLFLAYFFYLQIVKLLKWKIQFLSLLTFLISTILITIKLI
jgi:hypothetical protein